VRFGFRDYDPLTGRFTAMDPLGYAAGDPDLYGYCLDDPVNMVDPYGLAASDWWDVRAKYTKAHEIAGEELAKRGRGNHNNEGDAMRHAEWSRRMSEEIDPVSSWIAGTAHEIDNIADGHPWSESMMDLHNNAVGREAAAQDRAVDRRDLQKHPKGSFQVNPYDQSEYWWQK
jgi:uncharacterized protein RhaS with RHS repeats